ncbi:Inositolphosphorylceramide synthase subunit Kei1-domain-containing protein [Parasitella parasitica]|nr:Inositolphosphorylceramide synthase subunit Kei1-domain-containing protein [Parasitella parasitica]
MAIFSQSRNCCFFIPLKTGVYLITIIGLLNKLSGFYGLISLDYSNIFVVCVHVYSLLALFVFGFGLYSLSRDKFNFIRWFTLLYWVDFIVSTITTIVFSVQWFIYTDHSLPELENDPEQKQQHDDSFRAESIVSIVILCLVRFIHLYFAHVITCYYVFMGKTRYSKMTAVVDEELNFAGYDEMNEDDDDDDEDSRPFSGRTRPF